MFSSVKRNKRNSVQIKYKDYCSYLYSYNNHPETGTIYVYMCIYVYIYIYIYIITKKKSENVNRINELKILQFKECQHNTL